MFLTHIQVCNTMIRPIFLFDDEPQLSTAGTASSGQIDLGPLPLRTSDDELDRSLGNYGKC